MSFDISYSRKQILQTFAAGLTATLLPAGVLAQTAKAPAIGDDILLEHIKAAEKLAGLEFSDDERKAILADVRSVRGDIEALRKLPIRETTGVPLAYAPVAKPSKPGGRIRVRPVGAADLARPSKDEDIAFLSVVELGRLLRSRRLTSVELTRLYLGRLKKYGDDLLCLVTLTEDLAMRQAEEADRELQSGHDRGPLHGIPYGAKDLLATKGIPTTWGADPYKSQVFDYDAAVVERLHAAGAVLVAKLSMGALAQGDVWFKGTTKNPGIPSRARAVRVRARRPPPPQG